MLNTPELNINKYLVSIFIDVFVLFLFIICSIVIIALISGLFIDFENFSDALLGSLIVLDILIITYVYFFVIFKNSGQTIAMKFLNLKVISQRSSKISYLVAFFWAISLLFPVLALISAMFLLVPPNSTFLERLTNTKIINI